MILEHVRAPHVAAQHIKAFVQKNPAQALLVVGGAGSPSVGASDPSRANQVGFGGRNSAARITVVIQGN